MSRVRRILRRLTIGSVLLALLAAIAFGVWMVATESGSRFTVAYVSGLVPNLKLRYGGGTVLGPLELRTLLVKTKRVRIEASDIALDWSPACLLVGELCITDLHAGVLTLTFNPPSGAPVPATVKRTLPALRMPLDIDAGHVRIDVLDVVRGQKTTRYSGVDAALDWRDSDIHIDSLVIGMPSWEARAVGSLRTEGDWPLAATLHFRTPRTGASTFTLDGTAGGTLLDARLALGSDGLVSGRIDGTLRTLQPGMPFTARARVGQFRLPPHGAPEKSATLDDVVLDAHGELLGQFTIDATGSIDTPWTPPLPATATSHGTWQGLEAVELHVDDPRARLVARSDYRWLGGQHFRGTVDVAHLDLSLVNANTPSQLAGRIATEGRIDHDGTRIVLDLAPLAGRFRQWPLDARGPLRWQDSRWHLDDLALRLGANLVRLDGELGDAWNARAQLALDDFHVLVPVLEGRAAGNGMLVGPPLDPSLHFSLAASDFRLPEVTLPAPVDRKVRLPAGDWQLRGTLTLRDVKLEDARTTRAPFALRASGRVGWQDGVGWDLATEIDRLHLADLLPELDGSVAGPLLTRGVLRERLESLDINTQLAGQQGGLPLEFASGLHYAPGVLRIEGGRLVHGDNRYTLALQLDDDRVALTADADAPDVSRTFGEARGALRLSAQVDGPRQSPDATLALDLHDLAWRAWGLEGLSLEADIGDGGEQASTLRVEATGLHAGEERIDRLLVSAAGTRASHHAAISAAAAPLAAALELDGGLASGWRDRPEWLGSLARGEVSFADWRWEAAGTPTIAADAQALALSPHCWTDRLARACLTAPARLGATGAVDAEVFHLPLQSLFGDTLPVDTRIDGHVGGIVVARWSPGRIDHLFADVRNEKAASISLASDDARPVLATLDEIALQATASADGGALHARVRGADAGTVAADIGVDAGAARGSLPSSLAGPLRGTLRADGLRLGLLEALTYQLHDVRGAVGGEVALGGRLDDPRFEGTVSLRDGQLAFTRLPLTLTDIHVDGRFDGSHATLAGDFTTPDSRGRARLEGTLAFTGNAWRGSGTLAGNDLLLAAPPEYQFTVAPRLSFALSPAHFRVDGEVAVPAGRLEMKALPAKSVQRSADVIVVHREQVVAEGGLRLNQDVDVDFPLGDDVRFRAFGGEGRLTGGLRVRSNALLPLLVDGELHLNEGRYRALGQQLSIKQGDIIFNGPADQPLIDALAVRTIDDPAVREVGLRLTGSLRDPQTTLWSTPEMSNEEVLAWLTTGRPLAEGPLNLRGEAAQAALSLGIAQGSAILTAAGQEVGLQDVQLATRGEGEKSEVQVGTNLNERVFVGYNRRVFTGDESVLLRLQLTRKLMLEALSGLDSALDLFYTFEF